MQLPLLTFVVGTLNFCLGYALGICWRSRQVAVGRATAGSGRRPPDHPQSGEIPPDFAKSAGDSCPLPETTDEESEFTLDGCRTRIEAGLAGLVQLRKRLREGSKSDFSQTVWNVVAEFQELCDAQRSQLEKALDAVPTWFADREGIEPVVGQFETVILEQMAQIETTLSNLGHFDFSADVSIESKRLRGEISRLQAGARALLDLLASQAATPLPLPGKAVAAPDAAKLSRPALPA